MPRTDGDRAPVLIFDLDGTILRINSFPGWVLFLIGGRVPGLEPGRRARLSLAALRLLCQRKFGRLDHDEMSRRLSHAWRTAASCQNRTEYWAPDRFVARLQRQVRANLQPVLGVVASGRADAVLATAAAADYAAGLGRLLAFRHVLATPSDRRADEPLNSRERKRDRVLDLLAAHGWRGRPLVLFTDHIDDLPLMRACGLVCWFGPERRMAEASDAAPATRFVFCRDLTGEAIAAIVRECVPVPAGPQLRSRREITAS
jgi:phosphoserine phosphatase